MSQETAPGRTEIVTRLNNDASVGVSWSTWGSGDAIEAVMDKGNGVETDIHQNTVTELRELGYGLKFVGQYTDHTSLVFGRQ